MIKIGNLELKFVNSSPHIDNMKCEKGKKIKNKKYDYYKINLESKNYEELNKIDIDD